MNGTQTIPEQAIRLAILASHPIQYLAPVFRTLACVPQISLTVLFQCRVGLDEAFDPGFGLPIRWDIGLLEGYQHRFLSKRRRIGGLQLRVVKTLLQLRPDVLIMHGYNTPTNLLALVLCKLLGTKVLLRGDTRLMRDSKQRSPWAWWLKRLLLRTFDGYLAIGSLSKQYYLAQRLMPDRIFYAPFCVDNAAFHLDYSAAACVRTIRRRSLGIGANDVVVLFASKLIPRKRAGDLLQAFARVSGHYASLKLIVAGSGEERARLQRQTESLGLIDRVNFMGFVNQSELPSLYAMSDIFVLPAENEPWALVVNEVMAAGLPVIVSDDVGAAADLVAGQGTGVIYPVGDSDALSNAIGLLAGNAEMRRRMSDRAREVISQWDVAACVDGIVDAAKAIHTKGVNVA